jgi:copper chaperone NosL
MAMAAVGLGVLCVAYEYRFRGRATRVSSPSSSRPTAAAPATLLLCVTLTGVVLSACSKHPATLSFGNDACDYCSMTISDRRHGALFVSDKGRSYKFDAVECMIESLGPGEKFADTTVHSFHVVDYAQPGVVVEATGAAYLVSPAVPSPMGANLSAFASRAGADSVQSAKGGDVMDWDALREHLRQEPDS